MYATGLIDDLSAVKAFIETKKVFEPDNSVNRLYKRQYEVYTALYPALQMSLSRT
jgi:hypothetical protein